MKFSTLALALCVCGCSILDEIREESQPAPEGDPADFLALANDARSTGRVCRSAAGGAVS